MAGKRIKRYLTEDEFKNATIRKHIKPRLKIAAHSVMVTPRKTMVQVEHEMQIPRQSIQQVVSKIWKNHLELQGLPTGWVSVTVKLPETKAIEVQKLSDDLFRHFCQKTTSN